MPQIRLEHVTKYYTQEKKRIAAVSEVDLTIEQGEFVFVTGSSGAGKSTLLQLISGELQPSSGAATRHTASSTPPTQTRASSTSSTTFRLVCRFGDRLKMITPKIQSGCYFHLL